MPGAAGLVTTNGVATGHSFGTLIVSVVIGIKGGDSFVQEQCVVTMMVVFVVSPVGHGSIQVAIHS